MSAGGGGGGGGGLGGCLPWGGSGGYPLGGLYWPAVGVARMAAPMRKSRRRLWGREAMVRVLGVRDKKERVGLFYR